VSRSGEANSDRQNKGKEEKKKKKRKLLRKKARNSHRRVGSETRKGILVNQCRVSASRPREKIQVRT